MTARRHGLYRALPSVLVRTLGGSLRALGPGDEGFLTRLGGTSHGQAMLALPDAHWAGLITDLGLDGAGTVVDIGCGHGAWLPALARSNRTLIGIDLDAESVAASRSRTAHLPNVEVREMAAEQLAFEDGSIDAAVCMTVLPYLKHPAAVREMARVLRAGAKLVIGTVGAGYYAKHAVEGIRHSNSEIVGYGLDPLVISVARTLTRREVAPGALRSWSPRAVCSLLNDNGFRVEQVRRNPAAINAEWPRRYLGRPFYFSVTAVRQPGRG